MSEAPATGRPASEAERGSPAPDDGSESIREATPDELRTWDARAVDGPGGHILQSLAWGEHRARIGLRIRHLVFGDGTPLLVLDRPWPIVGGSSAYLSRGPAVVEAAERTSRRVEAAAAWLGARGVDVVAADPEIAEATVYGDLIRGRGWHRIEELWQSRHRMTRPIGEDEDEPAAFGAIAKSTRQRIRAAERSGTQVLRFDRGAPGDRARSGGEGAGDGGGEEAGDGGGETAGRNAAAGDAGAADDAVAEAGDRDPSVGEPGEGFTYPSEPLGPALERFYGWLVATGERRGFEVGSAAEHVAWWRAAAAAGHVIYLEARSSEGEPIGGLVLYRHGERLTTASSADRAETRRHHPGALHLLRWRALQLAIREGRRELDMGGVDVPGHRDEPREGDPMWGLYQHKRAFGAEWLELTGAHEKVSNPGRYAAGRLAARLARMVRRPG